MGIGGKIRKHVEAKGLSIRSLAIKAGVPYSTLYSLISRDSNRIDLSTLEKIAAALDMNPADIDESLVINLGTDAMFEIGGEMIRVPGGTPEAFVLSNMDRMTDEAKKKVAAYTEDIASNPKNLRKRNRWQTEEENK